MFAISLSRKTALWLCLLFTLSHADKDCDKSLCRGPVKYYEELRCKPVYAKPDDCCPVRYNCSHLEDRAANKCYVNGREYSIGDQLRDEDRVTPCDMCICDKKSNDVASFSCSVLQCCYYQVKDGCYLKRKPGECCASEKICPKENEEKVTCRANGQIYHEGQTFLPEEKRDLTCTCMEGFTEEEFIEPFCKQISCGTEVQRSSEIYNKCIPVYYRNQSLTTSCSLNFRCQNGEDKIINSVDVVKSSDETPDENNTTAKSDSDAQPIDMKCTFGNMTMNIGDELNEAPGYKCVKCVCEIPPVPTCLELNYCP